MTKPRPANPQPTRDVGSDLYLIPRSKTSPAKNRLYDALVGLGWRFDVSTALWHSPADAAPAAGRLEYAPDLAWAQIQAPSASMNRGPVLLRLERGEDGEWATDGVVPTSVLADALLEPDPDYISIVIALKPLLQPDAFRSVAERLELCPVHICDVKICADDEDPECAGVR